MPKKAIAVVASDPHICKSAWKGRPELEGDSYLAIGQVADLCADLNLPLILAGDVFDSVPRSSDLRCAIKSLSRVSRVYYIQGQHEYDDPPILDVILNNTIHLKRPTEIGGVTFNGSDFMSYSDLIKWPESSEPADVYVMHQVWQDFMGRFGQAPMDILKGKCRLLVTGDFHKYVELDLGFMKVLSPGSTHMLRISEPPETYCFILYDDLSLDRHTLVTRKVFETTASQAASLASSISAHDQSLGLMPIVKVSSDDTDMPTTVIADYFAGKAAVFFVSPKKQKENDAVLASVAVPFAGTVMEEAVSSMRSRFSPDDPSVSDAVDLLESAKPPIEAVRSLRSKYVTS